MVRIVEVKPLSAAAEALGVLRASLAIVLLASFAIASSRSAKPPPAMLLPYQKLFADLPSSDQRMVRNLREAMVESENARGRSKQWPEVAALAEQGVAPFAADPIDRDGYAWKLATRGTAVNYLGESKSADFLLVFTEPDPGALRMPGEKPPPVDEQHHTLSDGTPIHVGIWMRAGGAPVSHVVPFPATEGWTQIVSKPLDPTL